MGVLIALAFKQSRSAPFSSEIVQLSSWIHRHLLYCEATSSVANGDAEEPTLIGRTGGQGEGEMIELGAEPTRVAVELAAPAAAAAEMVEAQAAARAADEQAPEGGEKQRIVLGLDGVQYDENPGPTRSISTCRKGSSLTTRATTTWATSASSEWKRADMEKAGMAIPPT